MKILRKLPKWSVIALMLVLVVIMASTFFSHLTTKNRVDGNRKDVQQRQTQLMEELEMKKVDPNLVKRIQQSAQSRIEDRKTLRDTQQTLDDAGRYHVDDTVREKGYEAVIRVLAARIKDCPYDFDADAIALAHQIPDPYPQTHDSYYTQMHPALVQDNFLRLLKPNLLEE